MEINPLPYEALFCLTGAAASLCSLVSAFWIVRWYRSYRNQPPPADGLPVVPSVPPKPSVFRSRDTRFALSLALVMMMISSWYSFWTILTKVPKVIATTPRQHGELTSYREPVTFLFSAPVRYEKLITETTAAEGGTWVFHRYLPWLPLGRKVTFMPKQSFPAGSEIMIYVSNITGVVSFDHGGEYLLELTAPPLPQVTEIQPADNATDIPADTRITITLSPHDGPHTLWNIMLEPSQFFTIERNYRDKLVLNFDHPLQQGTTYTLRVLQAAAIYDTAGQTVISSSEDKLLREFRFSTVKPPLINSFAPEGNTVKADEPVRITFDSPMQPDTALSHIRINPDAAIKAVWSNDGKQLTLTPEAWAKDTDYSVTFTAGLSSISGGNLEQDISYRFRTLGPVKATAIEPHDTNSSAPVDRPIRVTFDQPVDQSAAEQRFTLMPAAKGTFSWEDTTLIFQPESPLSYETRYTVRLGEGIPGIHGLPSRSAISATFTTTPQNFSLLVPYFRQQESFTCNIAATRMMLAYRGISLEESLIKAGVGSGGTRGSGNPHNGYVAEYGTYWEPIIAFVSRYKPNRFYENWSIADLVRELHQGNPILIWGQNGWSDPHELTWTTADGQRIYAINGMHSYVVKGYRGPSNTPTHILVNDPWRGDTALTVAEFNRRWSFFKTALVVDK